MISASSVGTRVITLFYVQILTKGGDSSFYKMQSVLIVSSKDITKLIVLYKSHKKRSNRFKNNLKREKVNEVLTN